MDKTLFSNDLDSSMKNLEASMDASSVNSRIAEIDDLIKNEKLTTNDPSILAMYDDMIMKILLGDEY